ncbi:exopolysaccharide biosynthesis protein [Aestuariibacter sp. AA17]|uniref:Exopolysaccharide biosynthesis protein n=1 Tax=Fluctibacter corallii TaxID=2984329 RepID=A0ABT3A5C1_9ALTE|nr:exopolysaccharide biosynthesis protein [Aestuariibacter sp. AA17]MCV2883834.1 exopolysaccharide biosynthesis protein [Aestuariibacter sp. AA17]
MSSTTLSDVLHQLSQSTNQRTTTLGDLVEQLESRGFGPMLMVPALIAILPTGAIPGIPSLCGILIFLISMQVTWGRKHPWLPDRITSIEISQQKLDSALDSFTKTSQVIDRVLHQRLQSLSEFPVNRIIALCCGLTGLLMIPLEVVPFFAAVPASAILFASLGLATKDGIAILIALCVQIASVYLVLNHVFGLI